MAQQLVTPGAPAARDPVLAALERIERRLDRIEAALEPAQSLARQAPGVVGVLADTFDSAVERAQARGIDVDERLRALVGLAERASSPEVLRVLDRLLGRLDLVERTLDLAEQAPGIAAMAVDTFDTWIARLQAEGIDVDDHARNLLGALSRLTSPEAVAVLTDLLDHVDELRFLLQSGVLSRPAVAVIGQVGGALSELAQQEPPRAGPFAALRALGDPDVQRALGFAIQLAQHFGKARAHLETAPAKALPEGTSS